MKAQEKENTKKNPTRSDISFYGNEKERIGVVCTIFPRLITLDTFGKQAIPDTGRNIVPWRLPETLCLLLNV
ncbi:hypothetical protein NQ318_008031 [Aromia moschata]|uniref:Uncharacterized protein n=1 Tax=Aromia moschata TaxID=1265417 RepID=A0AAV8XXF4_9CUCU|nr:hypothetical protein NQ318_008031 [Aromia moschata]